MQWVQRFADALAPHAVAPALRACRRMAARQAPFAELLLPQLLWDLAAHDEEHKLCRRISRQVRYRRRSAWSADGWTCQSLSMQSFY